ncbi:MAG TPA: nicotinate (nicotinamide) nucleotide adenylyltransferase, partial [Phycisphaerae bacterium]|nr:nicotinate (nicotinamide) nucleotide adenylyltransferase [Phycisphaerae bacterium]
MNTKIVLFGGTFDPVHNGHLIAARSLAEARSLQSITLVPTANPPHKNPANADGAHRLAMLKLVAGEGELFSVCDIEMNRTGPSYTIDTVRQVQELNPNCDIAIIIGADMLRELPEWHKCDELMDAADFIVAARPPAEKSLARALEEISSRISPS